MFTYVKLCGSTESFKTNRLHKPVIICVKSREQHDGISDKFKMHRFWKTPTTDALFYTNVLKCVNTFALINDTAISELLFTLIFWLISFPISIANYCFQRPETKHKRKHDVANSELNVAQKLFLSKIHSYTFSKITYSVDVSSL